MSHTAWRSRNLLNKFIFFKTRRANHLSHACIIHATRISIKRSFHFDQQQLKLVEKMETCYSERSMMTEADEPEFVAKSMDIQQAEDDGSIQAVEELQNHGIGAVDIQKLKLAGICTIKGVNMTPKRTLLKVKGLSEAKVDKIKEVASKIQECGFISALEYSMKRASVFKVSTGCEEFDKLLGGMLKSFLYVII